MLHFPRPLALAAALVLCAPLGLAGDYHDRGTLECGECHVMHTSPSRIGGGAPRPGLPSAGIEVGPLLKKDVNDLCLSCHDDSATAADVLGPNRGRSPLAVREAGSLNRLGGPQPTSTGHTLGSLDPAPGSNPPWSAEQEGGAGTGLTCLHCHTNHGTPGPRSAFRNLRTDAGRNKPGQGLVTYNDGRPGSYDPTADVFVRRARDYDESALDFNEPDARDSAMARYCAGCHGDFHGQPGSGTVGGKRQGASYTQFLRHPAAGVDIGAAGEGWSSERLFASRVNRVKVMSPTANWSAPRVGVTPTCITCHKAHGNDNAFGLIFRSGRGALTENGDTRGGRMEDLCAQCHDQASPFVGP
ncbi:MAG: hypothetical protein NTY35_02255 [Planctomycetota bacterium]|nr:hypothetical protein [Planctomycetota bacterium]